MKLHAIFFAQTFSEQKKIFFFFCKKKAQSLHEGHYKV